MSARQRMFDRLFSDWGIQRCSDTPAALEPGMNTLVGYASAPCPLSRSKRDTVVLQRINPLLIAALLYRWRPAAIVWAVWAVVVVALNAVELGWRFTHVGKEQLKTIPSLTDSDSSASVARVILAFLAQAAPAHHRPGVVLLGCPAVVRVAGVAVDQICSALRLYAQASARFGVALGEFVCRHDGRIAAIAPALPIDAARIGVAANYEKAAVSMADTINEGWHGQYPQSVGVCSA